jgi:exonuclease III
LVHSVSRYDKSGRRITNAKIACHNINGIKHNKIKLRTIVEWAKEEDVDILGLVETNSNSKELKHSLEDNYYRGIWSQSEIIKKKGSGVELLISQK